jgi:hypothetical protein
MAFEKQSKGASRVDSTAAVRATQEDIAKRAYEIFIARGGEHGHHEEDWLRAERELTASRREEPVINVKKPTLVRPS